MERKLIQNRKERKLFKHISYARLIVCIIGAVYAFLAGFCLLKPADAYSASERRELAQMPEFSWEALWSGRYTGLLEEYAADQFPMRDSFRSLKARFSIGIMQKQDTNGIYLKDGYLCEMEYPMDEDSIIRAANLFAKIHEQYLQDTEVKAYLSIIPDKNYFQSISFGKKNSEEIVSNRKNTPEILQFTKDTVLTMDYERFFDLLYQETPFLQPVSIKETLTLADYYKTDSHWKQEEIIDTAAVLADEMGTPFKSDFAVQNTDEPFYGVYYGQAGLSIPADRLAYCTNDSLEKSVVYDYENNREIPLYDLSKTTGRDPYEMFLGGNISLAVIENKEALSKKELVVFGDSFSRSLLPLLAGSYQKITLIDIRYLPSAYIGNHIEFTNQDVLFLYSTSVLNNSIVLK